MLLTNVLILVNDVSTGTAPVLKAGHPVCSVLLSVLFVCTWVGVHSCPPPPSVVPSLLFLLYS